MSDQETNEEILIILPNEAEMREKLSRVNLNDYAKNKLIPILLKQAGEELFPEGVIMMLTLAIADAGKGMPPMFANLMLKLMPLFIKALITDEKALSRTMEMYKEIVKEES